MTEVVQKWILTNCTGLKTLVNDKLAKRGGAIGGLFKRLEIGERQMGKHYIPRYGRLVNSFIMMGYQMAGASRPIFSRFVGTHYGPLNYTGIAAWAFMTGCIITRFKIDRTRDIFAFNAQDRPDYWFKKLNFMFPPQMMSNITSAHYIEINHIFTVEMFKKYRVARQQIIM